MSGLETLDRICPDESDLPPSARSWARIIRLPGGWDALELRDPNSGQSQDPARKPRHQYLVARDRLWSRRLPPAPLEATTDEARWRDEPQQLTNRRTASTWLLVEPGAGLPWEWSGLRALYIVAPRRVRGSWDIHGDGRPTTVGYEMPARDPWDMWADVTGAPCPAPGCDQILVWYEAGYVPGYRVCMRAIASDTFARQTLRHRWLWWEAAVLAVQS